MADTAGLFSSPAVFLHEVERACRIRPVSVRPWSEEGWACIPSPGPGRGMFCSVSKTGCF
ncbi:hypothetical protein HMPREF1548_04244 [Clostridium sp. KLE 1755]|nr:hypothetical protein HMPREF1548_04244 [Clostridium sp. KLE 1755]